MGKRILIISIKAGAGHLRAAQALEAVFAEAHPEHEVRHIEALEYTNQAFRKAFTSTYEKLATDLPSVWGYLYGKMEAQSPKSRTKKMAELFDRANSQKLIKEVKAFKPDAIISTHYFPAEILGNSKRKGTLDARLYVTLTDYDIHTMWIQEGVDRYFVATEEMARALHAKGIGSAQVSVTGIPLMPVFSQAYPSKEEMRTRLGLREEPTTVLVAAGGFGLAGIDKTVGEIADAAEDVQILGVAGKNEELKAGLEQAAQKRPGRIVPFGFVDNMHELMAAADFFVGKCGGLTSSECLAMGLPMVILSPIPGQEERNADFLLENWTALRANSAPHLSYKVERMLNETQMREAMQTHARTIARPRAAYDVAAEVVGEIR